MNPLETYLHELSLIHASGAAVPETSYYPALASLFNSIGKNLKPQVRCIVNIANRGAGIPDVGLFTSDQFQKEDEPLPGQLPARGVVEVKGTSADAWVTAEGVQVLKYWQKYRQVLVTNYRDFVLVGEDADGRPATLESYRLAPDEQAFWRAAALAPATAVAQGERFIEFVKRVMLHAAPLILPRDVAWFLASYARDARKRIEGVDLPALATVRAALEQALGLTFQGERGEHFFRSTLVQTLFYGVFSAWVLWNKTNPPGRSARFNWHETVWLLHVPVISTLFEQVATPSKLEPLGLVEVLDWTSDVLNRVDRAAFFDRFEEGHAVQYFYEPFLHAFDPELRKDLGVWYTPEEIVRYQVARVDAMLREELDRPDGLAAPDVYVLDPCCGTGTYLLEVLKRVDATLRERGGDALAANDLKRAAIDRIFGFELLPAPFVVAHLQLGLLLQNLGAPLVTTSNERAAVYLTNALTGWEPPTGPQQPLPFRGLEEERDAAGEVKREKPILVILGNPPYNGFAGVSPVEEQGLVEPYKEGLIAAWGIKKFNLDDLYVRFFRLAERRIAEQTGKGVVCYISNFSYLNDPSFVVMRQRFLREFDTLWFDCLNGDSRETGKRTPEGKPDPSVFSTEYNREGIRLGTTIGLLVRKEKRDEQPTVRFRQFWGVTKRADLVDSLKVTDSEDQYEKASPDKSNRFSFRPSDVTTGYLEWPKLVDLCQDAPISGLQEMRRGALMGMDRDELAERMRLYFDPKVAWDSLNALQTGLTRDGGGFNAKTCRAKLLATERFDQERIMRYALYPFDNRWCYHIAIQPLWNRPRPALAAQLWPGNSFIVTRMVAERPNEQIAITVTPHLPDYHLLRPNAVAIPIRLRAIPTKKNNEAQMRLLAAAESENTVTANLSPMARAYLASLGIANPDADADTAELIWMHSLAIGYSPAYLAENGEGIRQDWPRVPLPETREALLASAELGQRVAALLDTECGVLGVTMGTLRAEMVVTAPISRVGGGNLNPGAGDLAVTAGWGHAGQGGVTMPGRGKTLAREYTTEECAAIAEGAPALGLSAEEALQRLGTCTYDVYLNEVAYWRNVPARVWEYTIGGYQVMKKWLSYRERELLGRALSPDEAREVTAMARRITAILLLDPTLDVNYERVKANAAAPDERL